MRIEAGMLLSSLLVLGSLGVSADVQAGNDKAKGPNGKVYVCHGTSSAKNPSVLIHVSSSAARAHYNHGDPLEYTSLGDGECSGAIAPPPPPPPPVTIEVCATTNFGGNQAWWKMNYEPLTGAFSGYEIDGEEPVSGSVSPPGDLFVEGKQLTFEASGVTGESNTLSVLFGEISDDTLGAAFGVDFTSATLAGDGSIGIVRNCEIYVGI